MKMHRLRYSSWVQSSRARSACGRWATRRMEFLMPEVFGKLPRSAQCAVCWKQYPFSAHLDDITAVEVFCHALTQLWSLLPDLEPFEHGDDEHPHVWLGEGKDHCPCGERSSAWQMANYRTPPDDWKWMSPFKIGDRLALDLNGYIRHAIDHDERIVGHVVKRDRGCLYVQNDSPPASMIYGIASRKVDDWEAIVGIRDILIIDDPRTPAEEDP